MKTCITRTTAKLLLALTLVAVFALIVVRQYQRDYSSSSLLFTKIERGMSEQEVRTLLGEPYREHKADESADYYLEGWSHDKRAISGKVLIYLNADVICYVYFDRNFKVEHIFIGGS